MWKERVHIPVSVSGQGAFQCQEEILRKAGNCKGNLQDAKPGQQMGRGMVMKLKLVHQ